ncbi:MAG: hypothetical protein QM759_08695 [Terricaulis sp.]
MKVHYFGHGGGGGGAALRAHARYVAREAAALDPGDGNLADEPKSHAAYLNRGGRARFYDGASDDVDGAGLAAAWARSDQRHFRIILAPEGGAELGDLRAYTREVMARAAAALDAPITWVAVDHWDTDNPHTHIILRGRAASGRNLILPRDFVKAGMRELARDIATERLGARTPDDARRALQREARAHRLTRLDALLAQRLDDDGRLRLSGVRSSNGADVENALKTRARELQRLGLAHEVRRNVLHFTDDWRDRLRAMEAHLDIRKRLVNERASQRPMTSRARGPDL